MGKIGGDKQLCPLTVFVQYTFITVRFSAEYQTMYQLDAIDANNLISVAEHDWFVSHLYLQSHMVDVSRMEIQFFFEMHTKSTQIF